jgi:hypothetical protein
VHSQYRLDFVCSDFRQVLAFVEDGFEAGSEPAQDIDHVIAGSTISDD